VKVGLVASSGGHLSHLWWLKPWWSEHERSWVTFETLDAVQTLAGEQVTYAYHPTNRNLVNLWRNARLARRWLRDTRPDVLITSGAGVAIPFAWAAKAAGVPVVYLEVVDRISRPSLSARVLEPFVDAMVVQLEAQREGLPTARVLGAMR